MNQIEYVKASSIDKLRKEVNTLVDKGYDLYGDLVISQVAFPNGSVSIVLVQALELWRVGEEDEHSTTE